MTKKPTRGYVVDGRRMTADDLKRLHDYLVEMETISVISDQMRTVSRANGPSSLCHITVGARCFREEGSYAANSFGGQFMGGRTHASVILT